MRTHLALNGSSVGGVFAFQLDVESNCIAFSGYYHAGSIVRVNDTFATHIREIGIGCEVDNSPNVFCLFTFHRDIERFPDP